MAELYDFFSRKHIKNLMEHNNKQNDLVIAQLGKYIGVLTKQQTNSIRSTIQLLELKKDQIEMLMSEYDALQLDYKQMVKNAMSFLEVRKNGVDYSFEEWEFYVDKDGHCWVVKLS